MPQTDWKCWLRQKGPALALLARQYVRAQADAEDVVQEAFLRFWRSRDRVRDGEAYIFGCVRRVALDIQKGAGRRQAQERYRTTLMSIGDGVVTTDDRGRVELLNPVAEALTGWNQDQARGQEGKDRFGSPVRHAMPQRR